DTLRQTLAGYGQSLLCTDRASCGDGLISGSEECDVAAPVSGCGQNEFCDQDCHCEQFPVCGDGAITGSEFCDPSAQPTGCPAGTSCFACFFCEPNCGNFQLDSGEVCDPSSFVSGCDPGFACRPDCSGCDPLPDPCGQATVIPAEGGIFSGSTLGAFTSVLF